jgi:hypothetical protein
MPGVIVEVICGQLKRLCRGISGMGVGHLFLPS